VSLRCRYYALHENSARRTKGNTVTMSIRVTHRSSISVTHRSSTTLDLTETLLKHKACRRPSVCVCEKSTHAQRGEVYVHQALSGRVVRHLSPNCSDISDAVCIPFFSRVVPVRRCRSSLYFCDNPERAAQALRDPLLFAMRMMTMMKSLGQYMTEWAETRRGWRQRGKGLF